MTNLERVSANMRKMFEQGAPQTDMEAYLRLEGYTPSRYLGAMARQRRGVGEVDRLRPFIPFASDDPETVKTKLRNLKKEIVNIEEERKKQYTAQGMNYPSLSGTVAIPGAPSIINQYGLTPRR